MAEEKTIRERLSESVSDGFQKSTGVIVNNVNSVLGDSLGSLIDDVKNLTSGVFNVMKGAVNTLSGGLFNRTEEKTLDETKEQTGLLSKILDVFERQEKRQAREIEGGGGGILDIVTRMVGMVIGVVVGYLSTALGPFKSLQVVLKPFLKDGFVFKLFSETIPQKLSLLRGLGTRISQSLTRFNGVFTKINSIMSSIGTKIGSVFTKITQTFSNAIKAISQSGMFKFGVVIGKFLFWFRFLYDAIQTILSADSIRDKILGLSAKLISLVGEIPQLIINAVSKLFGSEFRVDFGKEAIINAVNKFSDWLFPNFTVPVLDFFTVDIPNFFKKFVSFFSIDNLIGTAKKLFNISNIKSVLSYVFNLPSTINNWVFGKIKSLVDKILPSNFLQDSPFDVQKTLDTILSIINLPTTIGNWLFGKVKDIAGKLNISNLLTTAGGVFNIDNIKSVLSSVFNLPTTIGNWLFGKVKDIAGKLNITNLLSEDSPINMDNIKSVLSSIFNIPLKAKDWLFDKVKGVSDKIKGIFGIFDENDPEQDRIENIKRVLGFITNMPDKIKNWLQSKIEGIINKIPDFLLPKSLENFKFDNATSKQGKQENLNVGKKIRQSEIPLSETKDRRQQQEEIIELKHETKKTNETLQKLLKETVKNGKTTEITNTTISQQNNSNMGGGSKNNIPVENESIGLGILNGAMK